MSLEIQTSTFEENSYSSSLIEIKNRKSKKQEIYPKKWTVPQNILYARYLKTHMSQMNSRTKKKCGKFMKMDNFIGSKTQNQCRSHHQKMMLTFKSVQNIIKYAAQIKRVGQLIQPEEYQQKYGKNLQISIQLEKMSKMEEQLTAERQSDQTIKQEKVDQTSKKECFLNDFPIIQKESREVQFQLNINDIFDVLSIDAADKYSQYFSC